MSLRKAVGNILHARPLKPGHASFYVFQVYNRGRNAARGTAERDHLAAAAAWLAAAQDSQTDGGFAGRYRLNSGWSSSYPETTGYIVPTCLALAGELGDESWVRRAERAIRFLLSIQLPSGAFPGGEIAENRTEPSPFNSAQILNGLMAWSARSGDPETRDAARRTVDWLLSMQGEDGAFRKYFYWDQPSTYSSHLSCWLADYAVANGDARARHAAERHLDWVLGEQDRITGWFDRAGFAEYHHADRIAPTHTIAYTIWGVLRGAELLGREDGIAAARRAADGVMRRLELSRRLPGMLGQDWKSAHEPQCLTGNAQMALIWLKLFDLTGDARYVSAALKAVDLVKRAQDLDNPNPGIRGGIPGSDPVWGLYLFHALPNWSAKFFIDALIEKRRVLEDLEGAVQPARCAEAVA